VRKRRAMPETSLSFLDVISCGFGAILLLLLIARISPPAGPMDTPNDAGAIETLQAELFEIRGETRVVNRELTAKREQLSEAQARIARAQAQLARKPLAPPVAPDTGERDRLLAARQTLTEEMRRLLAAQRTPDNQLVGGVPVDSEYLIFVIDTSGSMVNYAWPRVRKEMLNILDIYPRVKGIQVMSDQGSYMFGSYRGKWIGDTPSQRRAVIERLASWTPFSKSSPVEGIQQAIRDYHTPDKKISIYVFSDDFTGGSIAQVINAVDRLNRERGSGQRLVRIHAIGFPVHFLAPGGNIQTASRFAHLMRELSYRNGGTFVGLNGLD
jgi:hypothetical protein